MPRVRRTRLGWLAHALAAGALLSCCTPGFARPAAFTDSFMVERCRFADAGSNPFFVLEPGYQLQLEGLEGKRLVHLTSTVLDETRVVDGITTRIVEERETSDGALAEVSRNYFAICAPTNTVFYFGEDVDIYENGKVVAHDGAWLAGRGGAKAGVMMPGLNLVGARYMQESAPGVAMDRAETVSLTASVSTPAGAFANVLDVEETTPLEPGAREHKLYAPNVGLIQDGSLKLVSESAAKK